MFLDLTLEISIKKIKRDWPVRGPGLYNSIVKVEISIDKPDLSCGVGEKLISAPPYLFGRQEFLTLS